MPLNLLKIYNQLLELDDLNDSQRLKSLRGVFDRDIYYNKNFQFRGKPIAPTPQDGEIPMDTLFKHLTCRLNNPVERKRIFDMARSIRLHWLRFHLEENKKDEMLVFSVKEPEGIRTYIYDEIEKYVIVLEPKKKDYYFLLSAYYVEGKDKARDKMKKKYKRKLDEIH